MQEQTLSIDLSQSGSSELVRRRPLWPEAGWYFPASPVLRTDAAATGARNSEEAVTGPFSIT